MTEAMYWPFCVNVTERNNVPFIATDVWYADGPKLRCYVSMCFLLTGLEATGNQRRAGMAVL